MGTYTYELEITVVDNGATPKNARAAVTVNIIRKKENVYIDPSRKNDPAENGSESHPFNSWKDVTWADGNTYLQKKGTIAVVDNIVIGAANITLDAYGNGELPVITSTTNTHLLSSFEKTNITISNLHFKSPNAESCLYFLGATCNNIQVSHCTLEGNSNAIRVTDGKKFTFRHNTISSKDIGIYSNSATSDIYYNVIKDNNSGIMISSSSSRANIYNNIFVGNTESINAAYGELTLFNNIFYLSSSADKVLVKGTDKFTSDHNIYYPEQPGFIEIGSKQYNDLSQLQNLLKIDKNSISADPLFMDVNHGDYKLDEYSPAINGGINMNLGTDFYGNEVPFNGVTDIGVAEFTDGSAMAETRMEIYPNPSTGFFNLDITQSEENVMKSTNIDPSEIQVMDMAGKTIFSRIIEKAESMIHINIDLSTIPNGIYIVSLRKAGELFTEKLILNR
jgi:hypothetical protein